MEQGVGKSISFVAGLGGALDKLMLISKIRLRSDMLGQV